MSIDRKQLETVTAAAAAAAVNTDSGVFPTPTIAAMRAAGLLGLVSSREVGGQGGSLVDAATVVEALGQVCGSSAMIVCMHYCATAVIEAHGPMDVRRKIAAGQHLSTLAFSEVGSRSQFWAPVSSASAEGDTVLLTAKKSWVTSANHADSYVWSSRPCAGKEASTLWLVPRSTPGVRIHEGGFDGLGLRGNDSVPITAEAARLPVSARLGGDGEGFGIMMGTVLPWFNLLISSISAGLMEAATARTVAHASATAFQNVNASIADFPTARAHIARMRIATDQAKTLITDAITAVGGGRPDATLRVLESKAAAAEAATLVTDLAMRVCGGAAFRKEVGVDRNFRDARASSVMGPTTDVLYDFIGKAVCGLPLF